MKGAHKRFLERQKYKSISSPMDVYESALNNLTKGSIRPNSIDTDNLNQRLKINDVYAVKCPDDDRYFRSVMVKKNPMSSGFQVLITNPVFADVPPQMTLISQENLFKQMREMNANLVNTQSLQAFPFTGLSVPSQGASSNGLVSQHHLNQQKRSGQ